jgi:hypothetical protein
VKEDWFEDPKLRNHELRRTKKVLLVKEWRVGRDSKTRGRFLGVRRDDVVVRRRLSLQLDDLEEGTTAKVKVRRM